MTAPYYTLFLSAAASNEEAIRTLAVKPSHGKCNISVEKNAKTGSVTIAYSRKSDRDAAKEWALRFAADNNLDATGII